MVFGSIFEDGIRKCSGHGLSSKCSGRWSQEVFWTWSQAVFWQMVSGSVLDMVSGTWYQELFWQMVSASVLDMVSGTVLEDGFRKCSGHGLRYSSGRWYPAVFWHMVSASVLDVGISQCSCSGSVWPPYHAPSDGVFGRFDLAALLRLPHLKFLLLLSSLRWPHGDLCSHDNTKVALTVVFLRRGNISVNTT